MYRRRSGFGKGLADQRGRSFDWHAHPSTDRRLTGSQAPAVAAAIATAATAVASTRLGCRGQDQPRTPHVGAGYQEAVLPAPAVQPVGVLPVAVEQIRVIVPLLDRAMLKVSPLVEVAVTV